MSNEDKTIIQMVKDGISNLLIASVILALPIVFVVSRYENWNDDIAVIIFILCIFDFAFLLTLIDINLI